MQKFAMVPRDPFFIGLGDGVVLFFIGSGDGVHQRFADPFSEIHFL